MDGKKEDEKALDSVSQSIFVTVGTTRFDDLIKTVTCPSFLKVNLNFPSYTVFGSRDGLAS